MLLAPLRWLGRNLSTLLLAFVLALIVWVSAELERDPNVQGVYPQPVEIQPVGLDTNLLVVRENPDEARLSINAPSTIWDRLNSNPDLVSAWIDLSGLGAGEHTVPVNTQVSITPSQVVRVVPEEVQVKLEPLATTTFRVQPLVDGSPSLGYRLGEIQVDPQEVTISGPETLVRQVTQVRAPINIAGTTQTVVRTVPVQPLDEAGNLVSGVTVTPQEVTISQVVSLLGGYRNVVVQVVTTGQVADGFWLTNISVTPPNVTVFSSNPNLVNELPPFVETEPIDLTGLTDDTDIRAALVLPEGISLVGEQSVLVRIGIAAQMGSLNVTLEPEVTGLSPEFTASAAPETVEVILGGPLPILRSLTPASVRLTLDLTGLGPGDYQVTPIVDLLPEGVTVESILPQNVQVTITPAPTPTATSSAVLTVVPTPTIAPTETPPP
jgi:YbbR domain-containing protein